MLKTFTSRILLVAGLLLVVGDAMVLGDDEDTFHETYQIEPGTPVTVDNTNGNIEISTWDEEYAEVHAELRTRRGRDELELVEISVETNGMLQIETRRRRRESSSDDGSFLDRLFGRSGVGRWPQVDVEYRIRLPKTALLSEASTVNGNVVVENTAGDSDLRTTNGRVDVRDHSGQVRARSTNGNISIRGAVALIEAKTTNGSIDVEIGAERTEPTDIDTVNGGVDVILPENLNAALEVRTVNGGINAGGLTVMLEKISKNHLIGTLGTGGPELNIRTVNGGVNLRTRK